MIYTCECCDAIFEMPKTDKVIPCPYCGRINHDVFMPFGFATKLAVREATEAEKKAFLDPAGYQVPDHSEDWKLYLLDPIMAVNAGIDICDMPDKKLICTYLKTGKAPNAEIEEYVEKIRVAYFNMQYEMAMYDQMYFEPENIIVGKDDRPSDNDRRRP